MTEFTGRVLISCSDRNGSLWLDMCYEFAIGYCFILHLICQLVLFIFICQIGYHAEVMFSVCQLFVILALLIAFSDTWLVDIIFMKCLVHVIFGHSHIYLSTYLLIIYWRSLNCNKTYALLRKCSSK